MKIWYPINFAQSKEKDVSFYNTSCCLSLYRFKGILKNDLYRLNTRLPSMENRLKQCEAMNVTNEFRFNLKKILNYYIGCLTCKYDISSARCYYYVPDTVRCPDTSNSLNFVIRLVEYGNDTVPPLNWIRHSYTLFEEYIGGNNEC